MADQANSVEEWLEVAHSYKKAALVTAQMPETVNVAWSNAGFACECLLKAAIMAKERLNSWPTRGSRKELYTHDLKDLARILDMSISVDDPVAPAWQVVVSWRREHMYQSHPKPLTVVNDMMDAVFGSGGVEEWICQNFLKAYT